MKNVLIIVLALLVFNGCMFDNDESGISGVKIAISPGHGLSYNEDTFEWSYQRPQYDDLREDTYTQMFVLDYLIPCLLEKGAIVVSARSTQKTEIGASGDELWKEDSLNYLKTLDEEDLTSIYSDTVIRPYYALKQNSAYFISIHANSFDTFQRGSHVFIHGQNDIAEIQDSVPDDLIESYFLAKLVNERLEIAGKEIDDSWQSYGLFRQNFGELRPIQEDYQDTGIEIPAIMVFLGWIDNAQDREILKNPTYLRKSAEAIANSIIDIENGYEP